MSTRARTPLLLLLLSMLLAPGIVDAQGILLLAHGGRDDWNRKVLELASQVDSTRPVEVAFGMANKRTIQDALHRLEQRDVSDVVAVPLFVSSHSSVFRATEYLLGSRDDAPPQLEAFARMGARRSGGGTGSDPDFEWTTPVETTMPISVTTALDGHALVAEILLSLAADVSRTPEEEVVVLVAHGPSSDEDNASWLANMSTLVEQMRPRTRFSRIEHLTVRDDASDPVRDEATAELRAVVEAVVDEGKSVLIVPLLLSYGGIEAGIRERLEGLQYRMADQALLPDERLAEWVLMQAMERRWRPPDLVDAVASFGAVGHDGALYVYGGHVGRTHAHSIRNISPGFRRLVLEPGRTWEELARGPLLQGAVLVSDGTAIYRVGGMSASNATPAETEVLHSSRSAARYSVAEDRWERLPDLPAGRSSHDAVVAGGVLYVVGGWELRGPDEDAVWADTVLALALDRATEWRAIAAPFERRALAAGAAGGRIYALGGLTPDAGPQLRVDALDTASGEWVRGPDLPPAGSLQGFGVAAASHSDRVLASQADGKVYRLTEDAGSWELAATLATPRFMHRIIPIGDRVLGVGGASRAGYLAAIDVAPMRQAPRDSAVPEQGARRWPGFLGGRDTNVSRAARLPVTWSDDSVTWRVMAPGFGRSSPVVWDDTVFLTSLEGALKETLFITAIDLDDGSERWRRTLDAAETFEWNDYVSKGAPTPSVDAERLYAFFDSGDLLALTHAGQTVWHRRLGAEYGTVGGNHGVGNSVLLTDDAVVVLLTRRTYFSPGARANQDPSSAEERNVPQWSRPRTAPADRRRWPGVRSWPCTSAATACSTCA